jgi:hypothetical protein
LSGKLPRMRHDPDGSHYHFRGSAMRQLQRGYPLNLPAPSGVAARVTAIGGDFSPSGQGGDKRKGISGLNGRDVYNHMQKALSLFGKGL